MLFLYSCSCRKPNNKCPCVTPDPPNFSFLLSVEYSARDIGGQTKLRPLWHHYFINTDALIFVVDSNDHERIEEARDELFHILQDPNMDGCQTVLIFLNKQVIAIAVKALVVGSILAWATLG